jgi:hypothetical protein
VSSAFDHYTKIFMMSLDAGLEGGELGIRNGVCGHTAVVIVRDRRRTYCGNLLPFLIAVTPEGEAVMSVLEANFEKDIYEDPFRLVVSSDEPEIILRDGIFKNSCVISPKGYFVSEESD